MQEQKVFYKDPEANGEAEISTGTVVRHRAMIADTQPTEVKDAASVTDSCTRLRQKSGKLPDIEVDEFRNNGKDAENVMKKPTSAVNEQNSCRGYDTLLSNTNDIQQDQTDILEQNTEHFSTESQGKVNVDQIKEKSIRLKTKTEDSHLDESPESLILDETYNC